MGKKENISRHKKFTLLSRPGSKDPELTVDFRMISALHRGVPISQQARLLLGICHGSKSTQILAPFYQVASGGSTRAFQFGFVSRDKGEYIPPDINDPRFKDDKFKDDPDVRGILGNIKHDFDQEEKGIYNIPDDLENGDKDSIPTKDEKNEEGSLDDNTKKEEDGKSAGGAKNMKELLEKIYGARTKTAAETSAGGYTAYRDSDSRVILDVDEEREAMRRAMEEGRELEIDKGRKPTPGEEYSRQLKGRGKRGVFDLEELVDILKGEKLRDIVVIRVPEERQYCDFMIVATGRNTRHVNVVSSVVLSVYKNKMNSSDHVPRREGAENPSCGWIAMDMGNIVLHMLDQERRELYDLESLWTVGAEFDDATRNLEQTESSLDALERLMAVPSEMENTNLVEEKERRSRMDVNCDLPLSGRTIKRSGHDAVLPLR